MINWLRNLLNIEKEKEPCATCEVLKESLALERARTSELLKIILPRSFPYITSANEDKPESISPKQQFIPWRVKREMLEKEDRERARNKSIDELEKEINIS
jgi:hypothetical protein